MTTPLEPFRRGGSWASAVSIWSNSDPPVDLKPEEMAQPVRRVEARRGGFVYSAGWGGGAAATIGMLNGRDICSVFTTLRETNDGNGGPLAR
jgi:hypothetical protein